MSYTVRYEDIGLKDYKETWDYQAEIFKKLVDAKKTTADTSQSSGNLPGTLIFVEHPHVYTLGKSGSENNLLIDYIQLQAKDAKFYKIDRGGDITYHGPGQIVGYPIFDLEMVRIGLKEYIFRLEEAVIQTIMESGLHGIKTCREHWCMAGYRNKRKDQEDLCDRSQGKQICYDARICI